MNAVAAYLYVGLGSALGGMARYGVGLAVAERFGESFPWGTLLINVTGSFVIGLVGTVTAPFGLRPASAEMRLFAMAGLCGGFTTFSAFSIQTLQMLREGEAWRAVAYAVSSVLACIAGAALGQYLAAGLGGDTTHGSSIGDTAGFRT
ncbi:MAG TPA: fluoride efflux transporter CrcB [Stellaceae bacterium]|jgi:CrcB protein